MIPLIRVEATSSNSTAKHAIQLSFFVQFQQKISAN